MNRREFVNWVGTGALAASLPIAIAACQSDTASTEEATPEEVAPTGAEDTSEPATASDTEGFAAIGAVSELEAGGSLSNKSFQGEQVLVVRDPANEEALIAVNSMCTHQGCSVSWEDDVFACPCHGSSFNPDGSVASGPASQPLPTYEAKIEGNQVLVKVS
jgi:cytochrome b6-f complex iron-sulfur subunit